MKKRRFIKAHKLVFVSALTVLLIGGGALYAQQVTKDDQPQAAEAAQPTTDTSGINFDPPTEEEKKENEIRKNELIEQNKIRLNQETQTGITAVTPVVTSSSIQSGSQVTITSYVPGIVEDDGLCTMTATKGALKVARSSTGFGNATNTACPPFFINRTDFPESGDWSVVVTYKSQKAEGSSAAKIISLK